MKNKVTRKITLVISLVLFAELALSVQATETSNSTETDKPYCDITNYTSYNEWEKANDLIQQTGTGCDLEGAEIGNVKLSHLKLPNANMKWTFLTEVSWAASRLLDSNFQGAVLGGGTFYRSNLDRSDFKCASVSDVIFHKTDLINVDFRGAVFTNVTFKKLDAWRMDLRGADLSDVTVELVSFHGSLYDKDTKLPKGIDPDKHKMYFIRTPPSQGPRDAFCSALLGN